MDLSALAARDLPERHRSLRAVFDHSWRLLAPDAQRLFSRLSVFQGGFSREAAEQVAGASLAGLSDLITKSLLRHSESGRYDLHELVRQYAADRLQEDAEGAHATLTRHGRYYLTLLAQSESGLQGPHQSETVAELSREIGNLRLAWQWAAGEQQCALLQHAAWPLEYYHELRSLFEEGETAFAKAVAALSSGCLGVAENPAGSDAGMTPQPALQAVEREEVLAYLLTLQAFFAFRRSRLGEARQLLQPGLERLRRGPTSLALVEALRISGTLLHLAGKFEELLSDLREAYALAIATQLPWHAAVCASAMGSVEHDLGRDAESYGWHREAVSRVFSLGDPRAIGNAVTAAGPAARAVDRVAEMEPFSRQARAACQNCGGQFIEGLCAERLAETAEAVGDTDEARLRYAESVAMRRRVGDRSGLARTLVAYGNCVLVAGDEALARRCYAEALDIACGAELYLLALDALAGIATLEASHRADTDLLALVLQILQQPAASQNARSRASKLRADLESKLTREQIAAAEAVHRVSPCEQLYSKDELSS